LQRKRRSSGGAEKYTPCFAEAAREIEHAQQWEQSPHLTVEELREGIFGERTPPGER
jgi:hypothetical protein